MATLTFADSTQVLRWDVSINLVGEKVLDPMIHSCEICQNPILSYGRFIPCKHIFCYDCADKHQKVEKRCPRCHDPVDRLELNRVGQIFLCTFGAPRHSHKGCRRTYLSQRDLQAHINHRHSAKSLPPQKSKIIQPLPPNNTASTIQTNLNLTRPARTNLITIPLQTNNP